MFGMAVYNVGVMFIGLLCVGVHGRAVNISSTWFLPQEGFPVFYRYFKDKVTWNEADAICEFHHGDLITVDTSSQRDAARAYLKELDVLDHIWIGLMRESSEKPFTWMNGEKLSGDGYWLEQLPKSNEHLCAALDPTSDYRWSGYHCGGPQVASFICELPVPEWARKEDGCMLTSLPSLTVTLVPEMGVVELFSDCGLDGTRRIACKGGVNREELVKRLSCDEDAFSTIFSKSTTDLTKETDTQSFQSTWTNFNEDTISSLSSKSDGITQTTRGWSSYDTYEPQTRHRRDTNPSSPSTTQTTAENPAPSSEVHTPVDEPPSSSEIPSTPPVTNNITEVEILNVTSPAPKNEKIIESKGNKNAIPVTTTKRTPVPVITKSNEVLITEKTTKADTTTLIDLSESAIEPIILTENVTNDEEVAVNDESLIIITGETLNRSVTVNSPVVTSENPQIVVVIGDNDQSESNRSDPYIVSLSDDIIINNNPSISPVEVIDVDVVELDKLTTKSTFQGIDQSNLKTILPTDNTSPDNTPAPKTPLKIIQSSVPTTPRPVTDSAKVSTILPTNSSNIISTSTVKATTQETIPEVQPNQEKYPENVGELEEEKGDESDVPQRPNRGRLFTHSNHPSFYPYFLNRVLG